MEKQNKEKDPLTPRQRALRRYLWNNRTEWKSSKDIFHGVEGYACEGQAYKEINCDIHAINTSGEYDKKIITNRNKGYKLATKTEFKQWAELIVAESKKKMDYVYQIINSAKKDGQGIIPGLKGFKREFIESFVEEHN